MGRNASWTRESSEVFSESGQTALFLLASTVPWAVTALTETSIVPEILALCESVCAAGEAGGFKSMYNIGGTNRLFHSPFAAASVDEDGRVDRVDSSSKISVGPEAATAFDTLFEACHAARTAIKTVAAGQLLPGCLFAPWNDLKTELLYGLAVGSAVAENPSTQLPESRRVHNVLHFSADFQANMLAVHAQHAIGARALWCAPNGSPIGFASGSDWQFARFEIFHYDASPLAEKCCALSDFEKYVAFTYFSDIFHFFSPIINEDGTKLGSVDLLVKHLLSVAQLFPVDAHVEFILLEMLFQRLVQQPANSAVSGGIYRLLLALCKTDSNIPPVLALGTNILFQMVPDMDTAVWRALGHWFAFHVVNTKLSWPFWDFWVSQYEELEDEVTVSAPDSAHGLTEQGQTPSVPSLRLFCRLVVDSISRAVGVRSKVLAALPEALHALVPAIGDAIEPAHCPLLLASTSSSAASAQAGAIDADDAIGGSGEEPLPVPAPPSASATEMVALPSDMNAPHSVGQIATRLASLFSDKTASDDVADWLDSVSLIVSSKENMHVL
jgi:hypothetical protein